MRLAVPDRALPLPFLRHLSSDVFGSDLSFGCLESERCVTTWQGLDDKIAPGLNVIGKWPGKDRLEREVAAHLRHICARCPSSADQVCANVTQVKHAVQLT